MTSTLVRALGFGLLLVCASIYLLPVPADSGRTPPASPGPAAAPASSVAPPPTTRFGVCVEGLRIEHGTVHRGDTLAHLLGRYDVAYKRILEAADACRGVFDLRHLRPGRPFCALRGADGALRHFAYQRSLRDWVRFDFDDAVQVVAGRKAAVTRLRTAAATVRSSLWEALHDAGVGGEVIVQLDDVFGQEVDLFRLQPGDAVRLVYEEIWVDGRLAETGRVRAARLDHAGRRCNAFYFATTDHEGYFDEEGRSLQRSFLCAPLRYNRISSGFSHRRLHPILKTYRPHHAIDYAAPVGTPVLAVGAGTVTSAGRDRERGRYVRVRHGSRYESRYIHLSRFADGIRRGRRVERGEVIGYVGQTGLATGPHLDFAFYRDGVAVNYRRLEFPRAEPIAAHRQAAFQALVEGLYARLETAAPEVTTAACDPPGDPGA